MCENNIYVRQDRSLRYTCVWPLSRAPSNRSAAPHMADRASGDLRQLNEDSRSTFPLNCLVSSNGIAVLACSCVRHSVLCPSDGRSQKHRSSRSCMEASGSCAVETLLGLIYQWKSGVQPRGALAIQHGCLACQTNHRITSTAERYGNSL